MTSVQHDPAPHDDESFSPMRRARSVRTGSRQFPDAGQWLGYTVSAVMFSVGIGVMAGLFIHEDVPGQFRWSFGIVLALMGIYRFFITRIKARQKALEREEDE